MKFFINFFNIKQKWLEKANSYSFDIWDILTSKHSGKKIKLKVNF
jgi:hypothetical protein